MKAKDPLRQRMADPDDHVYVRLEAASTLTRIGDKVGTQFLQQMVNNEYLPYRLETVIILGEIKSKTSLEILKDVLFDSKQNPEIRAAAAWSIGELNHSESIGILIQAFDEVNELIRIEAARALAKFAGENTPRLIDLFRKESVTRRPGIAWALGRKGNFTIKDLLQPLVDKDARQWISYIIGSKKESDYIEQIEELKEKDPEVHFAVTVLWKIMSSWVYDLKEY
jgi:HEAT repeat protein